MTLTRSKTGYTLVEPDTDKEILPHVEIHKTKVFEGNFLCERFEKFSDWKRLVIAFLKLKLLARKFRTGLNAKELDTQIINTEQFIIRTVQQVWYKQEIQCIRQQTALPKDSSIISLNPYIDQDGLLRVGGRLRRANLDVMEKHPLIIPGKTHISRLLVQKCHEDVEHQGRHLTEGEIRNQGYWITGAKRLISTVMYKCVKCRKLRGKQQKQIMSDLPPDRITPHSAPFTFVGIDMFGPWSVVTRRTRGGQAHNKRLALLFTCLCTRAVHIEIVEDMSSSSFINSESFSKP